MNTPMKTIRFSKTYYFDIEHYSDIDNKNGYMRSWWGDNDKLRKAYKELENISNFYQAKLVSSEILNNSEKEVYCETYSNNSNHGWGVAYGYGNAYQSALVAVFSYEAEVHQDQYAEVIALFVKESELEEKIKSSKGAIQNAVEKADPAENLIEIQNTADSEILVQKSMFSSKYIISKTKREYSSEANAKNAIEKAQKRLVELNLDAVEAAFEGIEKLKEEHEKVREEINKYIKIYWKK